MADKKISDLTNNPSINGTEEIAEERGGSNYKNNLADVKTYVKDGLNTSEVTESTDKNYVTDAEKVVIDNTSNTNTGDETTATIQNKRPLKTVNLESLEGIGNITIEGGTITNGNGTTANGNAVDLGGTMTSDALILGLNTEFKVDCNAGGNIANELTVNPTNTEIRGYSDTAGLFLTQALVRTNSDEVTILVDDVINAVTQTHSNSKFTKDSIILEVENDLTPGELSKLTLNHTSAILQIGTKALWMDDVSMFLTNGSGTGIKYNAATDYANITWATDDDYIPSIGMIKDNTVQHSITGEPTGSDPVLNMVSLTQAEYDAGTPIATTLYVITD